MRCKQDKASKHFMQPACAHVYAGLHGVAGCSHHAAKQQVLSVHLLVHHATCGYRLRAGNKGREACRHEGCACRDMIVAALTESMLFTLAATHFPKMLGRMT